MIESKKIEHKKKKKTIYYKNAWLKIYDVPVLYYPFFFHPDPTVARQSGFLTPQIGESQTLGSSAYLPYFYVISDKKDLTENLMAEFSITHLRNVRATALSGGERRRLEICRCLITNPRVLLLDEPMAGVDLLSIQDIKSLLLKLQSRPDPVSCIISDHNASQLLKIVDRAVVLANGTIVANDSPRKLVNHPEARRLYFGKDFASF